MDTNQFTNLLRRHSGLIYKVAHAYCQNGADRDDVVQEIALQLWRCRDRYDTRFTETTWIYRIAINVAISSHRRHRRHLKGRESVEGAAITIAASAAEPGGDVERLMQCIHELSELDKALVLLLLDEQSHDSIAEVLGISVSNVGTKLLRIKNKLRVAFDQRACSNQTELPHANR